MVVIGQEQYEQKGRVDGYTIGYRIKWDENVMSNPETEDFEIMWPRNPQTEDLKLM